MALVPLWGRLEVLPVQLEGELPRPRERPEAELALALAPLREEGLVRPQERQAVGLAQPRQQL